MTVPADKQRAPLAPARVAEIKRKHGIATKLTVGSAHDELEHEADRVATEVVGYGEIVLVDGGHELPCECTCLGENFRLLVTTEHF